MNPNCTEFRRRITDDLTGELPADERDALEAHLAGCADCVGEREVLRATLARLREVEDVDVPRHFWVQTPRLRQGWLRTATLAAAALAVFLVLGAALSSLQVRVDQGVLMLSFGAAPEQKLFAELREELLRDVRAENVSWARQLRREIEQQGLQVDQALGQFYRGVDLQRQADLARVAEQLAVRDQRQHRQTEALTAAVLRLSDERRQ